MASGLVALLDDVAALERLEAESADDVTSAAVRAGSKTVGMEIDDYAVATGYEVASRPSASCRSSPRSRSVLL